MPRELESSFLTSDFVRHIESAKYCFDSRKIANATAATQDVKTLALPVKVVGGNWEVVLAADEANATAFLAEVRNETIAAGAVSRRSYTGIARGAAVVMKGLIPENDPAGNPYNIAALEAVFAAMNPPVIVRERTGLELTTLNQD